MKYCAKCFCCSESLLVGYNAIRFNELIYCSEECLFEDVKNTFYKRKILKRECDFIFLDKE